MIAVGLMALVGEALAFHSMAIFIWALDFFIANNIYFSLPEEPGLIGGFGGEYKSCRRNVPGWILKLPVCAPDDMHNANHPGHLS